MLNSDIVVAYYDPDDGSFHAIDYSVTARSQVRLVGESEMSDISELYSLKFYR